MKRVIIVLIMLATATATGNAQFFVEGSVGAIYRGGTSSLDGVTKDIPSSLGVNISPLVGYRLNENTALGIRASFYSSTHRYTIADPDTGDEAVWERKTPGWGGAVFDRYQLWGARKFSFLLESSIHISENHRVEKTGSTTTTNETRSEVGIKTLPLVSYDLSDRFSFIVSCDLFSLNLYALTVDNKVTTLKERSCCFDFSAQSDIFNSLPEIRIGIIYHFKKSGK